MKERQCKYPSYKLFHVSIKIGDVATQALVDTGASVSAVSEYFFTRLAKDLVKNKIDTNDEKLYSICGQEMKVSGIFELILSLDGNANQLKHQFYVIPKLTETCILGIDFITRNSVIFNGKTRKLSYVVDQKKITIEEEIKKITHYKLALKGAMVAVKQSTIKIDDPNLEVHREKITKILNKNKDMTAENLYELGKAIGIKHKIPTTGQIVYKRPRRQARALQSFIQKEVKEMLDCDVIEPSTSPHNAPILLAKKKGEGFRFCLDFRELNTITTKDKFPLPRIDETIDYLYGSKFFSTLDLISGYWQIEIDEEDKAKTAFSTEDGHYQFKRMPFGLTNAPATFQRLMNEILKSVIRKFALVYLDDVIIYSKTIEEHIMHIEKVLELLRNAGLKIKLSKCTFLQTAVNYLGHIISETGIAPDPKKTKSIKDYPTPKNISQLKSFLGIVGYYRKFIQDFAKIAHALTMLTRKNTPWKWTQEEEDAFQLLKKCLITPPILRYPNFSREFLIHTDASGYGVGSVLSQMHNENGEEKEVVIAYASRHLNDVEKNWSTIEKEAYAMVHAVKQFYPYLYGRKFKVLSDHKPLKELMKMKNKSAKLERWALCLQDYDIDIDYRAGKVNQNADFLSRIPEEIPMLTQAENSPVINALTIINLAEEQKKDKYCKRARKTYENTLKRRVELLNEIEEEEVHLIRENAINNSPEENVQGYSSDRDNVYDDDEKIMELKNGLIGTSAGRILVPKSLKEKILKRFHDSPYAGHLGVKKTAARIQRRFKWHKMGKDIKEYVSGCDICSKRKAVGTSKAPLNPIPPPESVWQTMAMDIMGPLSESGKERNQYILVMGEYLTRYIITAPMPDQTAETVARTFVNNVILIHGVPEKVLTDQGTNFQSNIMNVLYKQYGITRLKTTAYRPQCDGMVERVNRTLADILASYVSKEPSKWSDFLPSANFAYNTAVHSSTGYSPFYLMYGREAMEPQDMIEPVRNRDMTDPNMIFSQMWYDAIEITRERLEESKEKQKAYYDRNTKKVEFEMDEKVMLKEMANVPGKFNNRWDGPFVIKEKKGNVNYKILSEDGKKMMIVHSDRLKSFKRTPIKLTQDINHQQIDVQKNQIKTNKNRVTIEPRYSLRKTIKMPRRYGINQILKF